MKVCKHNGTHVFIAMRQIIQCRNFLLIIMVRSSGIRDKFIPDSLKELRKGRERGTKRPRERNDKPPDVKKKEHDSEDDEESDRPKALRTNDNLLSILPQPKNSSAFGPTVDLRRLLNPPKQLETSEVNDNDAETGRPVKVTDDGMIEVDVSKVVGDADQSYVKDLTKEQSRPNIVVPKGKEKQKNQITYLTQLSKATELERKEQAAIGRINKAAARSKYGW